MDFQNKDYSQKDSENFSASPAAQENVNHQNYQEESYVGGNRKNKLPPLETSAGNEGLKRQLNQMNIEDMNQDNGAEGMDDQNLNVPIYNQSPYQNNNDLNSGTQSQNSLGNEGQTQNTDEQVSVYMKDNMIMRRIQIEGDDREFLMDPQGQIFDMDGQFIGTANTNELEEL